VEHAELVLERRALAAEVRVDRALELVEVARVDAPEPLLGSIVELGRRESERALPAR
jgi:hypothetical protein